MSNVASIKTNRGSITFQLSSKHTKKYYPERKGSKYIYFGLPDNDENQLLARIKLKELIADLENGKFDPYNEDKYKHIETIEELIQKKKLPTLKDLATLEWNTKLKKGIIHESTYKHRFNYYNAFLDKTPEDITNIKPLAEALDNYNTTIHMKVQLLKLVITSIKWGIEEEELPDSMDIILKRLRKLKESYTSVTKKNKSCVKNRLGSISKEFAYYSEAERDTIIEAFYKVQLNKKGNGSQKVNIGELVEFIFRTGVRTQEAFALTWRDISYKNGDMVISINKAYASNIKKIKETKTGTIREFKANTRVKELLERMKQNEETNKDSLVFQCTSARGEFNSSVLSHHWYGKYQSSAKKFYPGVVYTLYEEGKISKYLNPYQMRVSFITHQLLRGKNPILISKWTGHDSKTLLEYYEKLTGLEESPAD